MRHHGDSISSRVYDDHGGHGRYPSVRHGRQLGLSGGELVIVPVPAKEELPREEAEAAIVRAT